MMSGCLGGACGWSGERAPPSRMNAPPRLPAPRGAGASLRTFSRNQEQSIRKGNEGRRQKRKEVAERKAAEKARLQEEIKRLKNLKKKEIEDKLRQIREVAGDGTLTLGAEELEEDFDEAKYDEHMARAAAAAGRRLESHRVSIRRRSQPRSAGRSVRRC